MCRLEREDEAKDRAKEGGKDRETGPKVDQIEFLV